MFLTFVLAKGAKLAAAFIKSERANAQTFDKFDKNLSHSKPT